jgi:hypothetical protein
MGSGSGRRDCEEGFGIGEVSGGLSEEDDAIALDYLRCDVDE